MRKPTLLLAALLGTAVAAFPQVSFTGLDLSPKDRLLFSAVARTPALGTYTTAFLADPGTRSLRQLTFYPEQVTLLVDSDVLQIQNRFGVFRSEPGFGRITPVASWPGFAGGGQVQAGALAPMLTSPDSRRLLFVRPRTAATGDLVVLEVQTGAETVISSSVEVSLATPPARWSPDSRFVVYARDGGLYYYSLSQQEEGRVLAEGLRRIGDGGIGSLRWGTTGDLYYIDRTVVYAIDPVELFTRALFAGFLPAGRVVGKIPFAFDPSFDCYEVSPDGALVLLNKGGNNLFLFRLASGDFVTTGNPIALPYLYLPRTTMVRTVTWSRANVITLLCETRQGGTRGSTIFRLVPDASGALGPFTLVPDTGVRDLVLSPDGTRVALVYDDGVSWKDYASWKELGFATHPSPLHVLWRSSTELLVAGAWRIELLNIEGRQASLVALSQVEEEGHAADGDAVLARARGEVYALDEATGAWSPAPRWTVREPGTASASWRVYLEPSTRGSYENLLMVRDAKGFGTAALFPAETLLYEAFPTQDEPVDFGNVAHGSRIRRREVSLVFNAMDAAEGLATILQALSAHQLRCTFFVNGEFIRRFPDAVKEIADTGHEVGSAFQRVFDMTDARFTIDRAFVKAGLAATEDEYFAVTGRELALLWHAPFYTVSSEIIAAGREMGYTYVGRDLDPLDWVASSETSGALGIYAPAAELVERLLAAKKPGSIIPILVGASEGPRDDYLFQKIDLVINELERLGYAIVPVSVLIEHAR